MALIRCENAASQSVDIFEAKAVAKMTLAANDTSISFTDDEIGDGSYIIASAGTDFTTIDSKLDDYRSGVILNYSWLVSVNGSTVKGSTYGQTTPPTLTISGTTLSGTVGSSTSQRYLTLFKIG